jgi:epoxyqueuosine reductase
LERALGARAGLGFVGKNTLLITPGVGSYTVLGELLLDLELESGVAQPPRCGSCRLCLEVCPTGAIIDEYRVDARRCISYLTIENSGAIPRELRRAVGSWIFGCDLCQEVCPWNAASTSLGSDGRPRGDDELRPRPAQSRPQLLWLLGLGAAQFRRFVKRTALRRLGRSQLLRNVAVALGNLGTVAELPALASALGREPPLVRQHLVWAIGEIAARDPAARAIAQPLLEQSRDSDEDSAVREEATVALTAAVR